MHGVKRVGPPAIVKEFPGCGKWEIEECPVGIVTAADYAIIRQWNYWRAERPWYGGGIGDMPRIYIRRMEILADQQSRIDEDERKLRAEAK